MVWIVYIFKLLWCSIQGMDLFGNSYSCIGAIREKFGSVWVEHLIQLWRKGQNGWSSNYVMLFSPYSTQHQITIAVYSSTSPQPTMFETCFCLTIPTVSLFRDILVRIHIPLYRHRYIMHMWKILLLIRLKSCDNIRLYDRYQYTNSIKWYEIGVTLLNKIQPLKV